MRSFLEVMVVLGGLLGIGNLFGESNIVLQIQEQQDKQYFESVSLASGTKVKF